MHHIDSQEHIKEKILLLEKKFPVDKWKINNIDVWPYIRIKIYFELLSNFNNQKTDSSKRSEKNTESKARKIVSTLKSIILLPIFFSKLKQKKILFFGSHIHRISNNGLYFNRFYDSIVDIHNLQDQVYMVEYQKVYSANYNQDAVIPLTKYLDIFKNWYRLKKLFNRPTSIVNNLDEFDGFCEQLLKYKLNPALMGLEKKDLLYWTQKMTFLQDFFYKFYKKIKPEKVFFLGYYGFDQVYAALIAANSLKIKTIDFQHGPQTNIHMAYSSWTKVPNSGFNTMPVEFWNWDENSKESIDNWAVKNSNIRAVLYGQPYLKYCKLKAREQTAKKAILYSLQTAPIELLTEPILNLMSKKDFNWVLRLHPRNETQINDLQNYLKAHNVIKNIIIQDPQTESLPEALFNSVVHVTNYSGCTIEAKMMGIPSILIHKVGKEMFQSYLDDELVFFLDQNEDNFENIFIDLVKKLRVMSKQNNIPEIKNPLEIE